MAHQDYVWIYDVNWQAVPEGRRPRYHAFKKPDEYPPEPFQALASVCGKVSTQTYETKTPGAPDCTECLKVTGPNPYPNINEQYGDDY